METQQEAAQPRPIAQGIHRLGRILVAGFYTSIGITAVLALAAAFTMGAFAPASESLLHYTTFARTLLVACFGLFASSGLIFTAWGLLQALYPAMFVPTMRRYFDPFLGQWSERLAARSTSTTVQSVFSVCRRLRFWGYCAIPFGLAMTVDALGLAFSFNQSTLANISSALPFSSSFLVLTSLVLVFSGRDSCWNRRARAQVLAEHQPDQDRL